MGQIQRWPWPAPELRTAIAHVNAASATRMLDRLVPPVQKSSPSGGGGSRRLMEGERSNSNDQAKLASGGK